jgi:hypothetical protein
MCDPHLFRTVNYVTAIAALQNPAITRTLGPGSRGWPKTRALGRHLALILLAALAAAFFVAALIATPPAATQRDTPIVQHPGPPSSGEILSGLNRNHVAP